jgi:hypothetical protein
VSAAVVNITNKAFSNTVPEVGNVMKQNPELMKMFSSAMAQSMSQQNPAFCLRLGRHKEPQVNTMFGAPPPVETNPASQSRSAAPSMTPPYQHGNRPDLTAGRGEILESALI